ncbi:potassium channel family protein [Alkaliphilus hydrothermalis]|uniref:Potassium channel domain-containing protein n=1 Tax=Alkaliphilus hydrothermalis TaxID=1482730 RepID=A0ABS2NUP0_9FIRM|nr:potassium channel family protein [Alkaliphilus hydrothermalis]MBM7616299.1 hypothetical protein [Alkaliphilus hydrothermalis]
MDKFKRILPLMVIYIFIVCVNIVFFAYLYDFNHSIVDPNSLNKDVNGYQRVSTRDVLYFSGITYLTIGYGDFKTVNGIGQFLAVLQGFSGVLINSVFTGLFLYYLVKRPKNILLSNNLYIRYKEEQHKFCLSIRIGNKGRPLVNVNRILELFIYNDEVRTRELQLSQEYHYLENYIYWEIDLHKEENQNLLKYLKSAVRNERSILIRISTLGTDADAGELVFTSSNYHNNEIVFIKAYHDLFKWRKQRKSLINWRNFDLVEALDKDKIEVFLNL